jgi:hypothetical protein
MVGFELLNKIVASTKDTRSRIIEILDERSEEFARMVLQIMCKAKAIEDLQEYLKKQRSLPDEEIGDLSSRLQTLKGLIKEAEIICERAAVSGSSKADCNRYAELTTEAGKVVKSGGYLEEQFFELVWPKPDELMRRMLMGR